MNNFAGSNLEWTNQTILHPVGFVAIVLLGTAMLLLPRRWAAVPMLVMACFIAPAQRIVIFGLDFNMLRVMVVFGALRLLLWSDFTGLSLRTMDLVIVAWALVGTIAHGLLTLDGAAVVNHLGGDFEALGMYFLFRCLIRNWDDLYRTVRGFAILAVPVALLFIVEAATGRNLFGFLGGVPQITMIRAERLRCQGAFAHPILAGCFWAAVMPLMAALWFRGPAMRMVSVAGVAASLLVVILCASSTPVLSVLLGCAAAACFALRYQMQLVRWGLLFVLVVLHMVMNAPVWHLVARTDIIGGSTGWHRYSLIDQTVKHFGDWWLLGTLDTPQWSQGLGDVTNQYVLEAVTGGLATLVLFVAMIALAFAAVGRLWRAARTDRPKLFMAWALGTALFIHVTNFMAVSYFGQINMTWYLLLGAIVSLDSLPKRRVVLVRRADPQPAAVEPHVELQPA